MKLKKILTISLVAISLSLAAGSSQADIIFSEDFDLAGWGLSSETVIDTTFLADDIVEIDSVVIELSHSFAADVDFSLYAPDGTLFDLTSDNGGSSNLGDGGSDLENLGIFTFTENSVNGEWPRLSNSRSQSSGTYQADRWGSGPFSSGAWRILLVDDAGGDDGAVGNITINGTFLQVSEPSMFLLIGLGLFGLVAAKRSKQN